MKLNYNLQGTFIMMALSLKTVIAVKHSERMLGGKTVKVDNYPYVAKISMFNTQTGEIFGHLCSAAIISPNYTVTVAHCIEGIELLYAVQKQIKLVIRYISINNPDVWSSSIIYGMKKHPAYKDHTVTGRISFVNDIGFVKHDPIIIGKYGKISAADYVSVSGQSALAFGFTMAPAAEVHSKIKYPIDMRVKQIVVKSCPKFYLQFMRPVICVSSFCGLPGTMCKGDSGAPLVHGTGIVALNSAAYSSGCSQKMLSSGKSVGLYTVVSPFIEWLQQEIQS